MNEDLDFHPIVYIEEEYEREKNKELLINNTWNIYETVLDKGIVKDFRDFVSKWKVIMPKTYKKFFYFNFGIMD